MDRVRNQRNVRSMELREAMLKCIDREQLRYECKGMSGNTFGVELRSCRLQRAAIADMRSLVRDQPLIDFDESLLVDDSVTDLSFTEASRRMYKVFQ